MPLHPDYTSNKRQLSGSGESAESIHSSAKWARFLDMSPCPCAAAPARSARASRPARDRPGASYRLVVPAPKVRRHISDIDGASWAQGRSCGAQRHYRQLASRRQFGFSGRYLEDDPLTEAIIASLVSRTSS